MFRKITIPPVQQMGPPTQDALPARVKALQAKVTALVPTVSRETDVAPDYWPFPEKPWLIKFDR